MVTSESNLFAWACRSSTVTAVRGLTRAQECRALRLTSNLWKLLVQQPEVFGEGILSVILGNLIRLAQEKVLPIPFELPEERRHLWSRRSLVKPYLFLHDIQSVLLNLETLDLFKYLAQKDR